MNTKRQSNIFALKFKFIGATNNKPSRYRVTQTNNNKSAYIGADFGNLTPFEGMIKKLDSINEIASFALVIDNTQDQFYTFAINTLSYEIPNLIPYFK
jgi:hypothetical protein